ncbi:hypothetical protein [Humibacter albus]|uniref:hypothetical protein n=1 Tax=Humibacter albus TaxID=427754 RepID=UPI0004010518|nr:hypothetical protein [Humibacter albus]
MHDRAGRLRDRRGTLHTDGTRLRGRFIDGRAHSNGDTGSDSHTIPECRTGFEL